MFDFSSLMNMGGGQGGGLGGLFGGGGEGGGSVNKALEMTGSKYQLPDAATSATGAPADGAVAPAQTQATVPPPESTPMLENKPLVKPNQSDVGNIASDVANVTSIGGADGQQNNLMNSNLRKTVKKVASAVASFYTGGLASAATNMLGSQMAENNPKGAGVVSTAGSLL
jgi:hypothetical protein